MNLKNEMKLNNNIDVTINHIITDVFCHSGKKFLMLRYSCRLCVYGSKILKQRKNVIVLCERIRHV